jgi:hypothetical protein
MCVASSPTGALRPNKQAFLSLPSRTKLRLRDPAFPPRAYERSDAIHPVAAIRSIARARLYGASTPRSAAKGIMSKRIERLSLEASSHDSRHQKLIRDGASPTRTPKDIEATPVFLVGLGEL